MKKEVRMLRDRAMDSLVLSIEHFNRPSDLGRTEAVLIFLDHAFEMLLKAAIVHRGGRIREPRARQTIGFDACVRKALSDGDIRFITEEQALGLQSINSLRDAAQHYLLGISERQLYVQAQVGLTLFRDVFREVFDDELHTQLPERVLPLSTEAPTDLVALFDMEIREIQELLAPGTRRGIEATARLRALAILDGAIQGESHQPRDSELRNFAKSIAAGRNWRDIFPGVASINLTTEGYGPSFDLRIAKAEGVPVHLVPEGTPGASVVAVKRVDELGFYNMSRNQLAEKVGLTGPKTTAVVRFLDLQSDSECFKRVVIGRSKFDRYSQKAITAIQEALDQTSIEEIWKSHGIRCSREAE